VRSFLAFLVEFLFFNRHIAFVDNIQGNILHFSFLFQRLTCLAVLAVFQGKSTILRVQNYASEKCRKNPFNQNRSLGLFFMIFVHQNTLFVWHEYPTIILGRIFSSREFRDIADTGGYNFAV
jgi:hypothetical protein